MKTLIIAALLVGAASCAHKVKVLDASAVSMTHQSLEPGQNLVEIGDVEGEFCADSFKDKGDVGLIDMAVQDAQKKSGADWITNAAFWRSGSCVSVTGTGKKLAAAPAAATKKTK
ncbi:MAG: hypothetical protein ACJ76H_15645 [Bacteriovoracaceae bacterium]